MLTLNQLAIALGAELRGSSHGSVEIGCVDGIEEAGPDALVFAEDERSFGAALGSSAGAVLAAPEVAAGANRAASTGTDGLPVLLHRQPRLAFARAAALLRGQSEAGGVHSAAVIASSAVLGEGVGVGAYAVIGEGCRIGAGSIVGSGAVLGDGVSMGRDCQIYPRVVVYPGVTLGERVVVHAGAVLGADGFGYVRDAATGEYVQFPQQGTLVLEDDVEVGANTTIDRGALRETRIGRGTKIDNLVHIGHNVVVGRNVVIASQVGVSGSTIIGDGAVFGGQVGIGDHAEVGPGVILGGQAGVLPHKSLQGAGQLFWGTPAKPVKTYLRELATLARLVRRPGKAEEK
ncbi:MAG TPA: UDP-3-O-(3-hydroxymyristoyl)glucosamine N-acyltransferase [Acidisarcina sp.]